MEVGRVGFLSVHGVSVNLIFFFWLFLSVLLFPLFVLCSRQAPCEKTIDVRAKGRHSSHPRLGLTSQSAGVWPRVTGPIFFFSFSYILIFFLFGSVNSSLSECHGRPAPQLLEAAVYAGESHPLSFFLFRTIRQKEEEELF
jgi:hypothetical protein